MSERQQRLRLGIFVLVSLALLAGLVLYFGNVPEWFRDNKQYTIVFSDAPGIGTGTPVRKSGVKVGEVNAVALDDVTGNVKVSVRLESRFTPRTSDQPTVTRGLLVGDTAIDFIPKPRQDQPGEPIPAGSTIQGVSPFNAQVIIDQALGVVPEAQRTLTQLRQTLETFDRIAPQTQTTLKDFSDLARAGREFVPELRRTNDSIRDILQSNDLGPSLARLVPELLRTNDEAKYFLKTASFWIEEAGVTLKRNEPRLVKAVDALTTTTERIGELMNPENQRSINEILRNVNAASSRFDRLAMGMDDLIKDSRGTLKVFNSTLGQTEQALLEIRQITRPFAERAPRIVQNIENGTELFNRAMVDIRELTKSFSQADGSIQKFISDPTFYNNLNDAVSMIARLGPRLERILRDAEVFADKIARHPELLGVGGAIHPSAGLKDTVPATPTHKIFKP